MVRTRVAVIAVALLALAAVVSAVSAPASGSRAARADSTASAASPDGADVSGDAKGLEAAYARQAPCVEAELDMKCLEDAVLASVANEGGGAAMAALARHVEERPEVEGLCHPLSHAAGTLAFQRAAPDDVGQLLLEGNTTCDLGYIHGLLDALGLSGASQEDLWKVAEVCDQGPLATTGHCHDGIGHAAWSASEDLDWAVEVCQTLNTESARYLCAGGILMQMFEPARLDPTYELSDAPVMLPKICSEWPDHLPEGATENPRHGCWGGSSYLLALAVTGDWFAAGSPDVAKDIERWQGEVAEAAQTCLNFGSETAARSCAAGFGGPLGGRMSGWRADVAAKLCQGLPVANAVADCARSAASTAAGRAKVGPDGSLIDG